MATQSSTARPRILSELTEPATIDSYDPSTTISDPIRSTWDLRQQGIQYLEQEDYEAAFVYCTRALTMIAEEIPRHAQYRTLDVAQKKVLTDRGEELRASISSLKPKIIDSWKTSSGDPAYAVIAEPVIGVEERSGVRGKEQGEKDYKHHRALEQTELNRHASEDLDNESDLQDPPMTTEESGSQSDVARTEAYLQILRRFQGFSWPDSMASQNYDKLDLSTKVTWEHWATARGHFADVYKGKLADSTVAIKLLRLPEYNPYTKEDYEHTYLRFFREMTIWAELKHVNIVSMIGFTAAKGMIGLVSPWHENGNLVDYLAANPDVSVPDLMLDVAEGTRYLHEIAHLAHGDLKGMNILIDQHGIARLTDFGISQQITDLNRHTGFTTTGTALGTTHWMAPEVLEGARPYYYSDVYSCAGVFLEICARKCPFHYLSKFTIPTAKLRGELPVRSHYPELDRKDELWNLFCRCWDMQTSKRPTIGMVVDTLYIECDLGPRPPDSVALRPTINRASSTSSVSSVTPYLLSQTTTEPKLLYSPPVPIATHSHTQELIPLGQTYPPPTPTRPPIPNLQPTKYPKLINLDQQPEECTPSVSAILSALEHPQGLPHAQPLAGSKTGPSYSTLDPMDHQVHCDACDKNIVGARFQCAHCPSFPTAFNLCSECEKISYIVHRQDHAFLKFNRRVDHLIAKLEPLFPSLYENFIFSQTDDLQDLVHPQTYCDMCIVLIRGAWFRCLYCNQDLCDVHEQLHRQDHVCLVLKSKVDLLQLNRITDLDDPNQITDIIPKVYNSV